MNRLWGRCRAGRVVGYRSAAGTCPEGRLAARVLRRHEVVEGHARSGRGRIRAERGPVPGRVAALETGLVVRRLAPAPQEPGRDGSAVDIGETRASGRRPAQGGDAARTVVRRPDC